MSTGTGNNLFRYFVAAFGFSWAFWGVAAAASRGWFELPFPNMVLVVVGAHGPLVSALVLTWRENGWNAVKGLIRSGFRMGIKPMLWLLMLILPLLLTGIGAWLNTMLSDFQLDTSMLRQPWLIPLTLVFMFFLGGSVQEEFGWRGYALPRLLAVHNPLVSALLLGLLWGLWHYPLFLISGVSQEYIPFGIFIPLTVFFSVMISWFYLKTGRNLFSALLVHGVINASLSVTPPIEMVTGGNQAALTYMMLLYGAATVIFVLLDRSVWFEKPVS